MFNTKQNWKEVLQSNKKIVTLIILLLLAVVNLSAQSGKWDATSTVGTSGFKDHGNGVMQLISTDAAGCAGAAVHERSEKYNPAVDGVFSKCYNVYFGCPGDDQIGSDTKGDGLAFSFSQCASYNIAGACGGGLGYYGACPKMITIEFDTWSSRGFDNIDSDYLGTNNDDEIAIHKNGDNSSAGKIVRTNPGNLEDGLEHVVCINYDPATGIMKVAIDGTDVLTHTMATADRLENYFGAIGLNQTWSSGKNGATNPATVSDEDQADLSDNVGALCASEITIISHTDGDILSSCVGPVTVEALAFPPAGNTINFVEFFVNGTSIGTDNSEPYNATWNNPALGENAITSKAFFTPSGTNVTSSVVNVIVGGGIEETVVTPTIDGTAEAVWTSKVAVPLNKAEGGVAAPDLDATYKTMYDANNLYVLVNVIDDNLSNDGGNHWENDGVEIYIDLGNDKSGAYGANDFQYTFVYNNAPTVIANRPAALTGVVFAQSVTAQGYQMEIRFPWTTLGGVPAANDLIGFDVMINDEDAGGARDHRLAWHDGTYSAFNNTALFGTQKIISCDPLIATVTSTQSAFCIGDSVKISAAPQDPAYTYEWFLNATTQGVAQTADSVFWAKVGGSYTVRINNGSSASTSLPIVITENMLPNAAAGNAVSICNGESTTLGASGGTSYVWSPTAGLSNPSIENPIATPSTSIRYTVTVNDGTCSDTSSVVVTVNQLPVTGIITSIADACEGDDVNLALTGQAAGTTVQWMVSNDGVAFRDTLTNTATLTLSGLAANEYHFKARISGTSCEDTTLAVNFTVNPSLAVVVSSYGVNPLTCGAADGQVIIKGLQNGFAYQLGTNGAVAVTNTAQGDSIVLSGLGAGSYAITIENPEGCLATTTTGLSDPGAPSVSAGTYPSVCSGAEITLSATNPDGAVLTWDNGVTDGVPFTLSTSTRFTVSAALSGCTSSDDVLVTVKTIPADAGNDVAFCAGTGGVTLNATGGTSYSWSPTTGLSDPTNATTTANPATTTVYTVTVTEDGCSATNSVVVTVNEPASAKAGNDVAFCAGTEGVQLLATGGLVYSWSPVTGLSNSAVANPIANPLKTTTYTVTVGDGECADTDQITVIVNALPTVNAGLDASLCADSAGIQLIGKSEASVAYSWSPTTGLSNSTVANPIASPSETTIYTLTVRDANCANSDRVTVTVERCKAPVIIPDVFTPNGDNVNDAWEIPGILSYDNHKVEVFNRWGNQVFESKNYTTPWDGTRNGDLLPFGTYYYIITLDGEKRQNSLTIIR